MSHPQPSILIVGAGTAGLVLGLCLLKYGILVRIIEKDSSYRPGQRGAGIQARTLEIHEFLGTLDDIQAQGKGTLPLVFYGPDGKTVVKTSDMAPHKDPTPSTPLPNSMLLGQAEQEAIFRSHIERLGGKVELSTELTSYTQTKDSVVAHIVKHVNGKQVKETIKYDYLVGADGGHSLVRKHLGVAFLGETRPGESIITGDIHVEADEAQLSRNAWHVWGDRTSKLMNLRRGYTNPNIVTIIAAGVGYDHAHVASSRETYIEEFYQLTGRRDIKFGELLRLYVWKANIRMVDKFSVGRVFLVGDAAHCHSPAGGQGANSSIQDSFNLAWKLALVTQGHAKSALLNTFSEERLPVIAEMLDKSTELLKKMVIKGSEDVQKDPEDSPWRKEEAMNQLGINYRKSSIVVEEGPVEAKYQGSSYQASLGVHAGDRAPDAPSLVILRGATESAVDTRLFKLFSTTNHTVLIFATSEENVANFAAPFAIYKKLFTLVLILQESMSWSTYAAAIDVVVRDQEGHAFQGYEVDRGRATVVVIRPDAYIGAIAHSVEGIQKYLERVLG